ncbi:Isoprenyl transferase [bioreactor metagenome]|uniref:Isoprenyl transferase n=1 Tax=bioreactor metagenome TaxID=1076179 RepID=A0A645BEC7_9ZZZZ
MNLLSTYLKNEVATLHKENVKLTAIGDINNLPNQCVKELNKAIELTKNNTGCNLNLALNYGGRLDIKNALVDIIKDVKVGKINLDEIDENTISNHLSTKSIPDPDLVIRTSGEERLSNFLLWEVAYAEFYFTNVHWPDFDEKELQKAIFTYQNRDRRFGGIK